jgi:hypothetical protein
MFRETVTNADGTTAEGTCTEAHALVLFQTAVRRGYRIEATRNGGVIITRDVHSGGTFPRKHTVTLESVAPTGTITPPMRRDLAVIAGRRGSSLVRGRIHAALYTVPAAAAARLIARGLVTVEGTAVSVSLAARLAMHAQDHQTRSMKPRGYYHDATHFGPWRKGSCMYDRSSAASCSCRTWSRAAEDVDDARRLAREHRQSATAVMVRGLLAA